MKLWDRTPERAAAVAAAWAGMTAVVDVTDAVRDAAMVLTLLRDGAAVTEVVDTAIDAVGPGAVWVQASTIGPESARALAQLADKNAVAYLDAPVSGSTVPARNGKLVWLVAGRQDAFDRAEPTLRQLGCALEHLGTGVEGSAIKLAVNAWMTAATVAMSDVLLLCDALGIHHELFVRVLEDGPLAMPYALQKAAAMDEHAYTPGFSIELARKDLALAAEELPPSPLLRAVQDRMDQAIADATVATMSPPSTTNAGRPTECRFNGGMCPWQDSTCVTRFRNLGLILPIGVPASDLTRARDFDDV